MAAGIEIRNSNSNLVIDGDFQNLALSSKFSVTCSVPDYAGYRGTFTAPANALVAVSDPKVSVLLVSRSGGSYKYHLIRPTVGAATVYVFAPLTSTPSTFGMQVFNESGSLVFDSGFKYLRVLDILNNPNLGPAAGGSGTGETRYYAGVGALAVVHSSPFFYGVDDTFQGDIRFYSEFASVVSISGSQVNFFADTVYMHEYHSTYPIYPQVSGGIPQFLVIDVTGY